MNALARDEDLFEERELFVILIDFELDQAANLFSCRLGRRDLRKVMDDWRHLLVDAIFDEHDRFGRERFRERRLAAREIVHTTRDKLMYFRLESFRSDQSVNL